MKQRQRLCLILILGGLPGCTLRDPLEVSVGCPDAEYYMNASGDIQGHFDDPSDPFYSVYLETQFCPMAFPECYPKEDGALCHESCRENEVFCTDHCVKPLEDRMYCGAKGLCNDGDVNSDDYRGKMCRQDQMCEEGQCICSRNTDIMCGDNCIDPNDSDDFCGAKGLCNSSDVNSDDYKGQKCYIGQRCVDGQCVCARENDIVCNGECIDPDNDMTYCGAKGRCTDSELKSENYIGQKCDESQICMYGQCVCARKSDIECSGTCIDPNNDMIYCGAKGLCTDSELISDNYKGITCDKTQRCSEGQCVCAREWDINCDGKCIDPNNDMMYCGARGLCTDSESSSVDYMGQTCDKRQRCSDGHCVCAREWDIECDGKCIDPNSDMMYCGAKGLCTDSELLSDNYKGHTCDKSQMCSDGKCVCARESDVICGGKCVNPNTDSMYCGAKGFCNEVSVNSENYQGKVCDVPGGQRCNNGVCRCSKSWELYCASDLSSICINPEEDRNHCGAKKLCDNIDKNSENFMGYQNCSRCREGICECADNEHFYLNTCEADSNNHCGEHGHACMVSDFNRAASVVCENKECVIKTCQTGSFLAADGKSCITCDDLLRNVQVGDTFFFGRYQQKKKSYGSVQEPIEWQVLSLDGEDSVLVISRFIIDALPYNWPMGGITWENCTLRAWLNGLDDYANDNFISTAFNAEELKCIQTVNNVNLSNRYYGTSGGNDTEDKVFLLSMCEAGYQPPSNKLQCPEGGSVYFTSDSERHAYATDSAYENGMLDHVGSIYCVDVNGEQMCDFLWWLRSPGDYSSRAVYVDFSGNMSIDGEYVDGAIWGKVYAFPGVRPAMWLKRSNGE